LPLTTNRYDLGNATFQWNRTYSQYFYGSGQFLTDLPTGGSGDKWIDGGVYIYPNNTFAVNVWIMSGYLNVTSWFRAYGNSEIYGNLTVHGIGNFTGNLYSDNLVTGEGNFTDNVFIEQNLTSGEITINLR